MKKYLCSFLLTLFLHTPMVQARTIDNEETGKKNQCLHLVLRIPQPTPEAQAYAAASLVATTVAQIHMASEALCAFFYMYSKSYPQKKHSNLR